MGLFSLIGGLIGNSKKKKASKKADQAQIDALNKSIAEQQRQYDQNRTDFTPYREAGASALGQMGDLTGLNGAATQDASINALKSSPLYQSLFGNGEEAVLQNASATGGIRGGNTQRGLADFGRDTLAQTIQQQYGNLGGIAGLGEGATATGANLGSQSAANISNALTQQGQVKASGLIYRGGLAANNWNSIGSFAGQAVSAFMPGGGGSSLFKF